MVSNVAGPLGSRDGGDWSLGTVAFEGGQDQRSASDSCASANWLLSGLSSGDFDLLSQHLKPVDLPLRRRLEVHRQAIEHVYFPASGLMSVVAGGHNDELVEIGMVGFEGMTGVPILLGTDRSPNNTFVQIHGNGLRILATELRKAMRQSETLRDRLLLFAHTFSVQVGHTARANARNKIEERLARWLLMAHDRLRISDIALTHEFLSVMLGVRRPGVTVALNLLEESALITADRGVISIIDRSGLERAAGGGYGSSEKEFNRVLGPR